MSVSPVREALRQLVTLGLAELVPYRGARVTRLDLEQMHAIYQLRAAVEAVTVRWAAAQISLEQEAALRIVLDELDRANDANDVRAAVKGNTTFHYELASTSGSPWAERVLRPLLETTQRYSAAVQRSQLRQQATTVESVGHREILDACVSHDPDSAAAALRAHLSAFEHEFDQALAAQATGDQQA
jgi:DNA-binding GntR family transcriptional regulator